MATKFADFMRGIENEARAEGPDAVAQVETLRAALNLGRRFAQARLQRNLTQKQAATRAGVGQSDVANIERGASNVTGGTLSAVASAVGVELDLRKGDA